MESERAAANPTMRTRGLTALACSFAATALTLAVAGAGRAGATPVGPLPAGPVSTITTAPNRLVAVALTRASAKSGLVWRIARRYDTAEIRQVSEADVGANVVLVFKSTGRGSTKLVFALTRGDASPAAVKAATYRIVAR